jgi:hypothetical protein
MYLRTYIHMYLRKYTHTHYIHTYLYTCIHTYLDTYSIYIHTYIHIYIHTQIRTYIYRYIHTYICTYVHTYIHTHIYRHTYVHTYIHIYTYIHTYLYTYTHTQTHTRTHIHTRTQAVRSTNTHKQSVRHTKVSFHDCCCHHIRGYSNSPCSNSDSGSKEGRTDSSGYLLIHCAERGGLGSDFCGYSVSTYCTITVLCILQLIQRIESFAIWYIALPRVNEKDPSVQRGYKIYWVKNSFTLYKVKVKVTLLQGMKAHRGSTVTVLRYCATNRKVAGSIPGGVIRIFHWHNPSDRTMPLGSTQPVTEMSTRSISWG